MCTCMKTLRNNEHFDNLGGTKYMHCREKKCMHCRTKAVIYRQKKSIQGNKTETERHLHFRVTISVTCSNFARLAVASTTLVPNAVFLYPASEAALKMCLCVCVCVSACVYTYAYINTSHTLTNTYTHVHTQAHIYTTTYKYLCIFV